MLLLEVLFGAETEAEDGFTNSFTQVCLGLFQITIECSTGIKWMYGEGWDWMEIHRPIAEGEEERRRGKVEVGECWQRLLPGFIESKPIRRKK